MTEDTERSQEPGGEDASPDAVRDEAPRRRRPRKAVLALVFATSVVVGSVGHFAVETVVSRGRVLPGVALLGVPLGGLSGARLTDAVRSAAPRAQRLAGKVQVRERIFDLTAADVGLELDVDRTAQDALLAGRSGSLFARFGRFLARPFSRSALPPRVRLNPDRTEARLVAFERGALGDPELEGSVGFTDRVVPTYPREGFGVVRGDAELRIERALVEPAAGVVALPVERRKPVLSRADVERAAAEATAMVASPVVLHAEAGDAELSFAPADLGHALRSRIAGAAGATKEPRLEVFLEREALLEVVQRARPSLEKPPRNATFAVGPKRDVSIVPSELGTRLDDDAAVAAVIAAAARPERKGELAFRTDVAPAFTTEQAEALHVRGFVSGYTTPFPCCEARVQNIERMAALVDGTIVRPGDTFSLNTLSGPRTAANGFVAGPTIVEGEMEMTIGGGVSQFATTLFNAAFDGGYEIIQRQPHTYWFPRYPEGHDATLGYPLPDLVFRNDSAAGILIKATVGKTSVRVELYGDNGGRRVERHVSPRFDIVKPETVLEPNPSLSPDETKVKFGGWIGWSLIVSRAVTFPDFTKKEEKRKVTYSPRARRLETHPCHIPEGQPGYTGEKCPKVEHPDGGAAP